MRRWNTSIVRNGASQIANKFKYNIMKILAGKW